MAEALSKTPALTDRPSAGSAKTWQDANHPEVSTEAGDLHAETTATSLSVAKMLQHGFYLAPKPDSRVARQLWQSRISTPADEQQKERTGRLKRLIDQVRSVRFRSKSQPEPVIEIEPATQTDRAVSAQKPSGEPAETHLPSDAAHPLPYTPVSEQTVKMLETLSQDPNQFSDLSKAGACSPSELADILFLSGQLKPAAVFYEQAVERFGSADVTSAEDRAWILFQLGNCLRGADLPTARKTYRQLIAEYPNSAWAELAKAWEKLIEWYLKDNPLTLIEEGKS